MFKPGWFHAWHFDESEFTTTLCLQRAERGGEFEFTPPIRSTNTDLALETVASTVTKHSRYCPQIMTTDLVSPGSENPEFVLPTPERASPITTASFEEGTLQIFAGVLRVYRHPLNVSILSLTFMI